MQASERLLRRDCPTPGNHRVSLRILERAEVFVSPLCIKRDPWNSEANVPTPGRDYQCDSSLG